MLRMRVRAFVFCSVLSMASTDLIHAAGYNTLSVDIPFGGGAMVTYSRFWRLTRYVDAGWIIAGGRIDREDDDLKLADGSKVTLNTEAWVAPLTGPVVTLHNNWIGISLGYAAFFADTDITMKHDVLGTLTGTKRAWGSGIYSPLLVLDFYDKTHDLVFGLGLGGYFGTSYPDLVASNSIATVRTDESPIDTLTFHVRCLWGDHRNNAPASSAKSDF